MEGNYKEGWYKHPSLGLIKVFLGKGSIWVFQCYTQNGSKTVSRIRDLDQWTWALSTAHK